MNIKEAWDLYRKEQKDNIPNDLKEITSSIINGDIALKKNEYLSNHTYVDAIHITEAMFDNTNNSMKIICGNGFGGFLRVLETNFRNALDRILKNKGFVNIIMLKNGEDKNDNKTFIEDLQNEGYPIDIISAIPNEKIRHMILCDDKVLREEKYHEPLSETNDIKEIQAKIHFDYLSIKIQEGFFDGFWKKLKGQIENKRK